MLMMIQMSKSVNDIGTAGQVEFQNCQSLKCNHIREYESSDEPHVEEESEKRE